MRPHDNSVEFGQRLSHKDQRLWHVPRHAWVRCLCRAAGATVLRSCRGTLLVVSESTQWRLWGWRGAGPCNSAPWPVPALITVVWLLQPLAVDSLSSLPPAAALLWATSPVLPSSHPPWSSSLSPMPEQSARALAARGPGEGPALRCTGSVVLGKSRNLFGVVGANDLICKMRIKCPPGCSFLYH